VEKFQPVLLKVWQEACRHIEIGELTKNIAPMLLHDIPMDQLLIREIEISDGHILTRAKGFQDSQHIQCVRQNDCSKNSIKKILKWCSQGKALYRSRESGLENHFKDILPDKLQRDIILGPIGRPNEGKGVLVLIAAQDQKFNSRHLALTQELLYPFSVARENDRRLNELAVLKNAAEAENVSLLRRLGREKITDVIVGSDSGLRMVMERIRLVSPLDVPVLILGETGTGKELIARALHDRSSRSAGSFIRVNCGAIPAELIDSQLFGHEKGAFTGATETRKGWFERADGGTLFLDEIGELSAAAQVRLLRILQDGWLERVGGQKTIHVDVRIIAATHRDLTVNVAENKFREDLWYRIAVFPIRLPALRERREDISVFATYLAERAAKRFGLYLVMPTPEQINLLSTYDWPGNVRELAAVIDRAAILGNGSCLEIAKSLGQTEKPFSLPSEGILLNDPSNNVPEIIPLDDAVREHIKKVLVKTKGRVEGIDGAAARLKVNPSTLRAKMIKLKIDGQEFRLKRRTSKY